MRNIPEFQIEPVVVGRRITVFAIIRNGKSEVMDFLRGLSDARPAEHAAVMQNRQVADAFPLVRESRLRKLKGRPFEDMWEVKRGKHRLYGFTARGGPFLCRYGFKTKRKVSRDVLRSVAQCRDEWREQYG
jgi:hypothetical protein